MPFVRSLAFKRLTYYFKLVAVILLLSKIMPICSRCTEKGLVYIAIINLSSRQPSFYAKCTKLNIRFFCNIRSVFNTKCMFFTRPYIYLSLQLLYLICLKVSRLVYYRKTRF